MMSSMINGWAYILNCQLISYINLVTNKLARSWMDLAPVPLGFTRITVQPV